MAIEAVASGGGSHPPPPVTTWVMEVPVVGTGAWARYHVHPLMA